MLSPNEKSNIYAVNSITACDEEVPIWGHFILLLLQFFKLSTNETSESGNIESIEFLTVGPRHGNPNIPFRVVS